MKKISLAILLILAFCSIATAAIKDSPDGFRGIKWGDPPSKLGARTKLAEDASKSIYIKTGDQLSIGTAKLEHIAYIFFQDRELAVVIIYAAEGINNSQTLLRAMVSRYGDPGIEEGNSSTWLDEKVMLLYAYDKEKMAGSVIISSLKISGKINDSQKQEAEKAAKDF